MSANKFQATMRSGPMPGKTFPIENEEAIVGRDLANDIVISDPEVSRRHARFYIRDENVFVEDMGSTNGTFLNGERISSPQQLRNGDVVTLGESVVLVFEKITEEPADTVAVPPEEATDSPIADAFPDEGLPPPPPQPHFEPETYQPPADTGYYRQDGPKQPSPEEEEPSVPLMSIREEQKKKAKQGGLPTWMIILIVAIVVIVCVIAVTLWFMPASWWCAITFDALAGCPLP